MRKLQYGVILSLLILSLSCTTGGVHQEFTSISEGWHKDSLQRFPFKAPDTTNLYDVFILIRNDESYGYANLFLLTQLRFPDGTVVADTLEYEMAKPDGTWLGKGFSSVKESTLWYKEAVKFPDTGLYQIEIQHAMRNSGQEKGVEILKGITEIGLLIESSKR